jgi:phosphatidylserine/phosphatidylglycerophosphate/cardiolipin synthase-like enzyme
VTGLLILSLFQANVYFSQDNLIQRLRARIDAAQSSIDICFYNCDSSYITDGLIAAHSQRQVRVRIVTDDARLDRSWVAHVRQAGIPVQTDSVGPSSSSLMHNKFAVFDYGDTNSRNDWLWTGSYNVFAGDFNADNDIEVQDSGLAHAYTQEFEQMWGGSGAAPVPANAKFHSAKSDRLSRHRFIVGSDTFRVYFSPQNRPVDTLVRLVAPASSEIGFCIYSFTYTNLEQAVHDRFQHGVWVGGVFDRSCYTSADSTFHHMLNWGMPVYIDSFLAASNLLHEKIMVIDRHITATGSVNWSNAGNSSNDENSLVINSREIAGRYREEISRRFNEAGGDYPGVAESRPPVPASGIQITGPTLIRGGARFECRVREKARLTIHDVAGNRVRDLAVNADAPTVDVSCAGLSPGVYVMRLVAGRSTAEKRIVAIP